MQQGAEMARITQSAVKAELNAVTKQIGIYSIEGQHSAVVAMLIERKDILELTLNKMGEKK